MKFVNFVLLLTVFVILLSACDSGLSGDPGVQIALWTAAAERTAEANAWLYAQQATATQGALDATATMVSATQGAATATAVSATQSAMTIEARMTDSAWRVTETGAAAALSWTQAAVDRQATAQAGLDAAAATVQAYQVEQAELAADRARKVNNLVAWLPYFVLGLILIIATWLIVQYGWAGVLRMRHVPKDARGDAMIYLAPGGDIVDPDLMADVVLHKGRDGRYHPATTDAETLAGVKARDQSIDLAHRGLPGGTARPQLPAGVQQALNQPPGFRVYGPAQLPAGLDRDTAQILDAEWREADDE
jgi:hypothetical protein